MYTEIVICDECQSQYYKNTSKMMALCPECSYILYQHQNCEHQFQNGRCLYCYWNGNQSDYIQSIKENSQ